MRAHFIFEKFTEDSDPIKDMDIGRQKLYKDAFIEQLVGPNPGGLFSLFLKNYLTSMIRLDTTYIKIEGNKITITESESPKGAFFTYLYYALDGNRNIKSMKKGVKRMIITLYEPLVESMNEKFVEDSDPISDMGIGFGKIALTKTFKILEFIASKGEEGASLTDIQHFIWTEIKGYPEEDFWQKTDYHQGAYNLRSTRGYWNTQLYGTGYYSRRPHPGILYKYCKKNEKGKWVLVRWPKYGEKLYAK